MTAIDDAGGNEERREPAPAEAAPAGTPAAGPDRARAQDDRWLRSVLIYAAVRLRTQDRR